MGQELQLPDWAQAGVPQAFAGLNPDNDNLSDGIGQSYPVIGYKGKQWSLRFRGERKNFMSSDGFPMPYIDVIILGQAKQKSKSFYAAFDPNSDGGRPICSSIDGVLPDPDVQMKQADNCALCPRNQWKQQPNGKKGRDCADFKRLAVLILPTQTEPLFGNMIEPAFLRVPAASLNSMSIMGDTMGSKGFHYSSYITRISFDPNEAHPKMVFKPLQPLTAKEAPVIIGMRDDIQVGRIINGGYAEGIRAVPPQEGTTLLPPGQQETGITLTASQPQTLNLQANANPAPTSGPSTAAAGAQMATAAGAVSTGLGDAPLATQVGTPLQPQSAPVSTGLLSGGTPSGGALPAQTQPANSPGLTTQSTVGDAGAPEAADADLDSMIAGALGGLGKK